MKEFARKPITSIEPLGSKLRRARETAGLSVNAVAIQTGIPEKYLHALEASRYFDLPGEVYIRNFLRICSQLFHLRTESVLELYERERRVAGVPPPPTPPRALSAPRIVNIPRFFRNIAIGVGIAALLVYLGLKVHGILQPPELSVTTPAADIKITTYLLTVEGTTEPESTVRVNGQEVFLSPDGKFAEPLDLQPGINIITISSKKERSREHVITRRVIVEVPNAEPSANGARAALNR